MQAELLWGGDSGNKGRFWSWDASNSTSKADISCPTSCAQGFNARAHPPALKEHYLSSQGLMPSSRQGRANLKALGSFAIT